MQNDWGETPDTHDGAPLGKVLFFRLAMALLVVVVGAGSGWLAGELRQRWRQAAQTPLSRLPSDFEHSDALLLSWCDEPDWKCNRVMAEVARAVADRIQLVLLVTSDQERIARQEFAQAGVEPSRISYVQVATPAGWARQLPLYPAEDFVTGASLLLTSDLPLARALKPASDVEVREWSQAAAAGQIVTNGLGLGVATHRLAKNLGVDDVRQLQFDVNRNGAIRELVWVEPLEGESTGRADLFLTFVSADTVIVGQYAADVDSVNAGILDRNADALAQVRTAAGPLRVLRVPMPARQAGKWFSYTTALLVNRSVLLPRYEHVSADIAERAHQVYRDALPGWQIVTIHADALVLKDGSLRQACLPLVHRQPDS